MLARYDEPWPSCITFYFLRIICHVPNPLNNCNRLIKHRFRPFRIQRDSSNRTLLIISLQVALWRTIPDQLKQRTYWILSLEVEFRHLAKTTSTNFCLSGGGHGHSARTNLKGLLPYGSFAILCYVLNTYFFQVIFRFIIVQCDT